MKWSRLAFCSALMTLFTLLVVQGFNPWITVSLGVFAAYSTFLCTRALWHLASLRVAVWRANLFPPLSTEELIKPSKRANLWWLANPKLDPVMNIVTLVGVLLFPVLLWLPIAYWLVGR